MLVTCAYKTMQQTDPPCKDVINMFFNKPIQLLAPKQQAFFMKTVGEEPMVTKRKIVLSIT